MASEGVPAQGDVLHCCRRWLLRRSAACCRRVVTAARCGAFAMVGTGMRCGMQASPLVTATDLALTVQGDANANQLFLSIDAPGNSKQAALSLNQGAWVSAHAPRRTVASAQRMPQLSEFPRAPGGRLQRCLECAWLSPRARGVCARGLGHDR